MTAEEHNKFGRLWWEGAYYLLRTVGNGSVDPQVQVYTQTQMHKLLSFPGEPGTQTVVIPAAGTFPWEDWLFNWKAALCLQLAKSKKLIWSKVKHIEKLTLL